MAQRRSFRGTTPAPEFPAGLDWINSNHPLSWRDLRGKVVLLSFETYSTINCQMILPELASLENKYRRELVVIGVHSAKFANERESAHLHKSVHRYEIQHPVVNDSDYQVWRLYDVHTWPTLVLVDPEGKIVGYHSGESASGLFDNVIRVLIDEFDDRGQLNRQIIPFMNERQARPDSPLRYPGKVLADDTTGRLFIADTGHNRIVVTDLSGKVQQVYGSGRRELVDGSSDTACFNHPQGLALDRQRLYVADTDNHAIRVIDLEKDSIETIAGTGRHIPGRAHGGPARGTPLNSPWDVAVINEVLYITMAGSHQIWALDFTSDLIYPYIGSGREGLVDDVLDTAQLAQSSGLSTDGKDLYFADAGSSSIRAAQVDASGRVQTLAGTGLFEFGDIDGMGDQVRLQHCLGITWHEGILYIADTYNHKIKSVNPRTRQVETWLGTGAFGWSDGSAHQAQLDEPGNVSIAQSKLYVADTHNHAIRVSQLVEQPAIAAPSAGTNGRTQLESRQITGILPGEVQTLFLHDPEGLLVRAAQESEEANLILLTEQVLSPGRGRLRLGIELPKGYLFSPLAPCTLHWQAAGEAIQLDEPVSHQRMVRPSFPIDVGLHLASGRSLLTGELILYYCASERAELSLIYTVQIQIPVTVRTGARQRDIEVSLQIPAGE